MKRQVVITGIGMVTPLGNTTESTWASLLAGRSGIGAISRFASAAFPSRIAGEIRQFDPASFLPARVAKKGDPFMQYALSAALMALEDAGLEVSPVTMARTGVLIGSSRGGVTTIERNMDALIRKGYKAVSPYVAPFSLINMASSAVAMKIGATGPCLDVSTACATGTHAVGEAMKIIQRNDADIMFAGGSEAPLTPLILAGFCRARALSRRNNEPEKASRPFDADRDGFVLAEGAGVLVLEEAEIAIRRGAKIYAELAGYGLSSDAFHFTRPAPRGEGSARAMIAALADAGMAPDTIEYVNAHGTATVENDRAETLALKKVFGAHPSRLVVSSSKSMLGHMLGAAGAVEAAISALVISRGAIPPTINLDQPDPGCDLDYIPHTARYQNVTTALSNSLGFGGTNAALVFRRFL